MLAASHAAPISESRWTCAARPSKVSKKMGQTETDEQTDRQTVGRQTDASRLPLDAASVISN